MPLYVILVALDNRNANDNVLAKTSAFQGGNHLLALLTCDMVNISISYNLFYFIAPCQHYTIVTIFLSGHFGLASLKDLFFNF